MKIKTKIGQKVLPKGGAFINIDREYNNHYNNMKQLVF